MENKLIVFVIKKLLINSKDKANHRDIVHWFTI